MGKLKMPDFQTDAEEAAWWFNNQDEIAREAFEENGLDLIAIPLEDATVAKERAASRGVPYEEFMRDLIHRALVQEQQAA